MIITLKGANFKDSNIGTLSTWTISRVLGDGATYNGVTYVDKNAALNATVTIDEGYELGTAGVTVTMGGTVLSGAHSISGNVITITIASVTGNVLIKVPTINTAGGEEDVTPDYTFTINPTPVDAAVTLTATGYTQSGNSITVPNGTTVSWRVSASGYTEQNGTWTANGSDETKGVELVASGGGETEGTYTFIEGQYLETINGKLTPNADWGYCETYLEVNAGDTLTVSGVSATGHSIILYNSNKIYVNYLANSLTYTIPDGVSFIRINCYKNYYTTISVQW